MGLAVQRSDATLHTDLLDDPSEFELDGSADVSGVFFVTSGFEGGLRLVDPRPAAFGYVLTEETGVSNYARTRLTAIGTNAGVLIVFPSWLPCSISSRKAITTVNQKRDQGARIAITFN